MTYVTLDLLKQAVLVDPSDDTRDDLLNQALATASEKVETHCGNRRFTLDEEASARTFATRGRVAPGRDGELLLLDDIGSLDDLVVELGDGTTFTAVTNYFTEPDNALARNQAITGLRRNLGCWSGSRRVRVTATWGWPAVPEAVVQATLLQATRYFKRKDSPEGVMGSADWGAIRVSRLDPDVQDLLKDLRLDGFG